MRKRSERRDTTMVRDENKVQFPFGPVRTHQAKTLRELREFVAAELRRDDAKPNDFIFVDDKGDVIRESGPIPNYVRVKLLSSRC